MAKINITNQTVPDTPGSGTTELYVDSTSKVLKSKDDAGVVTDYSDTTSYTHPNHSGEVTSTADGAQVVASTAISNKSTVTAAATDEILISDASDSGALKKVTAQTIADLGGGGGGTINNPFAAEWQIYKEEFAANSYITPYGPMNLFGAKSGTGALSLRKDLTSGDEGRIGIHRYGPGTAASGYSYMPNAFKCMRFHTSGAEFRTGINLKVINTVDATNDVIVFQGVSDVFNIIGSNSFGLMIDRTISATNWVALTRLNNTSTTTDTGIAFDTNWVALESIINTDATEVTFYIDGVLAATHTTHVPSQKSMGWNFKTQWVAGASRETYVDAAYYAFRPNSARGATHTWIAN